jgi:hypothetical protein
MQKRTLWASLCAALTRCPSDSAICARDVHGIGKLWTSKLPAAA